MDQKIVRRARQINPIDIHVGSRVRDRRVRLAMSQGKLGEYLGLTFQQIQKYEKGGNRIGAGRLLLVARVLGVEIAYFYEGIEPGLSGAEPRSAEEQSARLVTEFVSSSDGAHLIRAFTKITDAKIRKRVVNLVKSLAQEESVEPDEV